MTLVDVVIPIFGRKTELAVTLASLYGQTFQDFNVIISDQSETAPRYVDDRGIRTLIKALPYREHRGDAHHHLPRRGWAAQRNFLTNQAQARFAHVLDDAVLLESETMERIVPVILEQLCGSVSSAATGLDYLPNQRPDEQGIGLWWGPITPAPFRPDHGPWDSHKINKAANPLHLQSLRWRGGEPLHYKVPLAGWVNVLMAQEKLLAIDRCTLWNRLPTEHAGDEVGGQFLALNRFGSSVVLPTCTNQLGLPATVEDRRHNASQLVGTLVDQLNQPRSPGDRQRAPASLAARR